MTPLLSGDCEGSDRSPRFRRKIALRSSSKCPPLIRGAFYLLPLLALCAIPFAFGDECRCAIVKGEPSRDTLYHWLVGGAGHAKYRGSHGWGLFPANGKFYAVGGRSMDGVGNDFTHPFEYDPSSNAWTVKSATFPDNQVSDMACGVLTDSGTSYIYCVGGSAGGQTTATDRVFRYNPASDVDREHCCSWPGDSDGITLPGGFAVFNNKLYILGGFRINTAMTEQIWEFTPTTNVWVQKNAVLPVARGYIPTTYIEGKIYTAGGSDWNGTTLVDTNDSFRYDPVADSITSFPNIPRATGETQALTFQTFPNFPPGMWVIGGGRTPPNPSNEVDIYTFYRLAAWRAIHDCAAQLCHRHRLNGIGVVGHIWMAGGYASDGVTPLSSMEIFCSTVPSPTPTPTATATATPSPTPTATLPPSPCTVTSPMCGIIVVLPPTDFIINLSDPVDPATVQASDLTVNGTQRARLS